MSAPARRSRDSDLDTGPARSTRRGRRSEAERAATKPVRRKPADTPGETPADASAGTSAGSSAGTPAGAGQRRARRARAEASAGSERARRARAETTEQPRAFRAAVDEPSIPIRRSQRAPEAEEAVTVAPARPEPQTRPRRSRDRRGARPRAGARGDTPDRADRPGRLGRARAFAAERVQARRARVNRGDADERGAEPGAGRASFVVAIIALLVVGVAATLWLSTQAIADSYRLEAAKEEAARLAEQKAVLQREVAGMESAPELAKRARELGMIPAGDPAWLRVGPDGKVTVVGEATPVTTPPPPVTSAPKPTTTAPTTKPTTPSPGAGDGDG